MCCQKNKVHFRWYPNGFLKDPIQKTKFGPQELAFSVSFGIFLFFKVSWGISYSGTKFEVSIRVLTG